MKNWVQGVIDALKNGTGTDVTLYEMQLTGGTVYLTDCARDVSFSGNNYISAGQVISRAGIRHTKELSVASIDIEFTLVEQGIWSIFGNTSQLGRRVIITEVVLNNRGQVIGEKLKTINRVNSINVSDDDDKATVSVNVSNIMADFETVRALRTTQASHQRFWPQSTSFINSKDLTEDLKWGGK